MSTRRVSVIRKSLVHLPDIVAVVGAIVVFVVAGIADLGSESLIQATCGILALLSMSLLIVRVTKLDRIDDTVAGLADAVGNNGELRVEIDRQRMEMHDILSFLNEGKLDEKLLTAAAIANGYLRDFARMGSSGLTQHSVKSTSRRR